MAAAKNKTLPDRRNMIKTRRLPKEKTGIAGLDEVLNGGVPSGRNTLIVGGPGSGKTLIGMEFLVRGAQDFNQPGICMSFEESAEQLSANMASLGRDVGALEKSGKLLIDYVYVERKEIEETGEYDLEGLFIRLDDAVRRLKAKRVLLDTIEVLFSGLTNVSILRAELRRLFRWLSERKLTTVITAEGGVNALTRYGLEEYVADCVLLLDHRVTEQVSTRRIRVLKYRGSPHGTNEYPFLIDNKGISVVPITSIGLTHQASTQRLPSGVDGLDEMLDGKGFFRGSSILVSGTAGTGKSSFAAAFVDAACSRGERALYLAFEESPSQILRNMRSVDINLERWLRRGLLRIEAVRPTSMGLEGHLAWIHKLVEEHRPSIVVMDPITNLVTIGDLQSVKAMLTRIIDFLKMEAVTAMFTNLTFEGAQEQTAIGISSLMDTWMVVRDVQRERDRQRVLYVLKSRGMAHSSKTVEFTLSNRGIEVLDRSV
jgi:circadian clock protein KaiC